MSASDANLRRFVGFELELSERRLIRDGDRVPLEPRAFDTLAYLAERPDKLVRKRELIDALWPGLAVTDNALTRCIAEIRKALGDDARSPRYVQTVPRLGYRFIGEAAPEPAAADPAAPHAQTGSVTIEPRRRPMRSLLYVIGAVLLVAMGAAWWYRAAAPGAGPEPAAPPRSIAVLPFLNLSGDPRHSYLSDGLAENLLDLLAAIPDVKVVARTSSFAFRGRDIDARAVGKTLGVAWLLEGSVQSDGDRLRVTVQLIDAATGYHAWSKRYDRQLTDVFALQDEIATATASRVGSEIGMAARISAAPTENLRAYRQYLIGREHFSDRGPGWRRDAGAAFSKASELDEEFAAAHAGLAMTLAIEARFSIDGAAEHLARARTAAERALELDPELAVAHAAMGLVLDFEKAPIADTERSYRAALERDPLLIEAHNWLSAFLTEQGRIPEAQEQHDIALALDPLNPVLLENRSIDRELGGDYAGARQAAERLLVLPRRPHIAWYRLGSVEASFGNITAALTAYRTGIRELEPPYDAYQSGMIAIMLARLGAFDDARTWLLRVEDAADPFISGFFRFNVLVRQGNLEPAGALARSHALSAGMGTGPVKHAQARAMDAIWRGDFDAAVSIIEPLRDGRELFYMNDPDLLPGPTEGLQLLALAYERTGKRGNAAELLDATLQALDRQERNFGGLAPGLLYEKAACLALLGDTERAAAVLAQALDGGWNDWHRARHDVRWEAFRESPWFGQSMERARDEIARQQRDLEPLAAAGESPAALP